MTPDSKLNKLKEMMSLLNEGLTREEFMSSFKAVIDQIKKIESELIKTIGTRLGKADADFSQMTRTMNEMRTSFERTIKETQSATETTFAKIKQRSLESMNEMFRKLDVQGKMDEMYQEHEAMMEKMDSAMPDHDKMMAEMMKEMMEKMPAETPESVRDKLESLGGEERLAISSIAHLEETLKELKKSRVGSVGGFNYGSLSMHIIDDETPVGTINSVNTVFTINNPPSPVSSLKVYRGGARQRITEDYTFSGSTLTFVVAPQVGEIILCDYRV